MPAAQWSAYYNIHPQLPYVEVLRRDGNTFFAENNITAQTTVTRQEALIAILQAFGVSNATKPSEYIALALEMGIISGYNSNSEITNLGLEDPVLNAQLLKVLANTANVCQNKPVFTAQVVSESQPDTSAIQVHIYITAYCTSSYGIYLGTKRRLYFNRNKK